MHSQDIPSSNSTLLLRTESFLLDCLGAFIIHSLIWHLMCKNNIQSNSIVRSYLENIACVRSNKHCAPTRPKNRLINFRIILISIVKMWLVFLCNTKRNYCAFITICFFTSWVDINLTIRVLHCLYVDYNRLILNWRDETCAFIA